MPSILLVLTFIDKFMLQIIEPVHYDQIESESQVLIMWNTDRVI